MKKTAGKLLSILLIMMVMLAGCGSKDADTAKESATSESTGEDTAAQTTASVKSKVKFAGTYTAGDTIKIQMDLDQDGNCDYGYTGMYKLVTNENGLRILNLIYYGEEGSDSDSSKLAYDAYAVQKNDDGTYTRCKYTEGEEPDFSGGTVMQLQSGEDSLMTGDAFDAEYSSDGGAYVKLNADGTFVFGVHMKYAADSKKFELIGESGSSVYTYETDDDQNSIILKNSDGDTTMSLQRKEN